MSIWKKIKLPLFILVVGITAITFITMSKPTPKPNEELLAEPPRVKAAVLHATREQVVLSATSQGTVKAKREVELVAQVSGLIVKVDKQFVKGDFFTQNSILIEIDSRDYHAALLSAKSRLAQAQRKFAVEKGTSRQARREWQDLGNKEANDLFLRLPQLLEAQAAVESGQADVEIAQLNIKRTKIRVPFDGRIQETFVNVGQFVTRGTPLAKVYDTAIAEVRLPLSDRQLALLDLPMLGSVLDSNPAVTLSATIGGKAHQWQGIITRTEASVDVNSRMYYAIVEVVKPFDVSGLSGISGDNQHTAPLIPGLFVNAKVEGKKLNNVIVLPNNALVKRTNIYTVNDKNTIEIQQVTVLSKNGESVWIQSSIADKTAILLEKHAVVSAGTIIEPLFDGEVIHNADAVTQVAATIIDGE